MTNSKSTHMNSPLYADLIPFQDEFLQTRSNMEIRLAQMGVLINKPSLQVDNSCTFLS